MPEQYESSLPDFSRPDLDLLLDFLRFRSVSTKPDHATHMRACANWLSSLLRSGGFTAEVAETGVILWSLPADRRPGATHGAHLRHYDVQPEEPLDLWTSLPFEPAIRNKRVFARFDRQQGPDPRPHPRRHHMLREAPPVNLIFLIEEIGSSNLDDFTRARRNGCGATSSRSPTPE